VNNVGIRKAALAIAAMHPADRRWMMARLPGTWQALLGPLVREARRFTVIDADALQGALDGSVDVPRVDLPSPGVLIAVLNELSSHWAARVLAATAMDHAELYLAACGKQRGDAIRDELAQLQRPFPRALAAALVRCLDEAGRTLVAAEASR
jgi:hypothetical protein